MRNKSDKELLQLVKNNNDVKAAQELENRDFFDKDDVDMVKKGKGKELATHMLNSKITARKPSKESSIRDMIESKYEVRTISERIMSKSDLKEVSSAFTSGSSGRRIHFLDKSKYILKRDVKGAKSGDYINIVLPKGTEITNLPGGLMAKHKTLEDRFSKDRMRWNSKYGLLLKSTEELLNDIENNS